MKTGRSWRAALTWAIVIAVGSVGFLCLRSINTISTSTRSRFHLEPHEIIELEAKAAAGHEESGKRLFIHLNFYPESLDDLHQALEWNEKGLKEGWSWSSLENRENVKRKIYLHESNQ